MSDDRISTNAAIDAALRLDGDPQNVKQYYADWARHYDRDVSAAEYSGPAIAARLLQQHLADPMARILDAGCGTGLVGAELQALGYGAIDGFDLSSEMAELSRATGAYRQVVGDIDMMHALEDYLVCDYDALLSIGVFTLGHVPPQALTVLLQLLRAGGLLLISTRSQYYQQTDYQQQVDALLDSRKMSQLQVIWDAPYNHDGGAHYWVFRKDG
jgi:predicted TPR repeat methyltransferase